MLKWLKYVGGIALLLLALLIYKNWASDIPHHVLAQKYATGASDFITLPSGATAHYRIQGNPEGEPLVLLHGSNSSLHTWEPWVNNLKDTFFIVTVDLPGHGLTGPIESEDYTYNSMILFIKEFMQSIEINKFSLGGNSMGGGIALAYALQYPGDVTSLVLVDAAGVKVPLEAAKKVDRPIAFELAGRWYSDWIIENITPRSLASEGLKKSVSVKEIITEDMVDRYWELVRHPGNRHATGLRFAWYRNNASHSLAVENITQPTLILWGEDDSLIPVESGIKMDRLIPNSKLLTFKNVGHLPMEEAPEETANAVRAFLNAQ
ncbi:alpha/beta fold hydrolase [Kordiimonas aquimaris]|uniref:alpha/beta fold hydrolase n=1 Tax=Kordiimonas aquimaris TaxID=707591 RepID=UPI0021D2161C|nr:alpha/beta hydrolase [Kordiimonas aquimaris]